MTSYQSQISNSPATPMASGNVRREDGFLRQRLFSLDTYRGLIMVTLAFSGFGLAKSAANMQEAAVECRDARIWDDLQHHFSHVEWVGCGYWDLIQPSFMFMVGVAMAYSYLQRERRGQSYLRMFLHVLWRSIVLILLGVFFSSRSADYSATNWAFMNVLTQIGLGYPILFLGRGRRPWLQLLMIVVLLGGTWSAYYFWQDAGIPSAESDQAAAGSNTEDDDTQDSSENTPNDKKSETKKLETKKLETKKLETKKSETKKSEAKKSDEKKSEAKKSDEKKSDEKSDEKKSDEKKSDEKKSDEKKSGQETAAPIATDPMAFEVSATGMMATKAIVLEEKPSVAKSASFVAPDVGVTEEFVDKELKGLAPQWHKNANFGHWVDTHFLNTFPRPNGEFAYNRGGYQTINFAPSIATMLLGLMCGELLRSATRGVNFKLLMLLVFGAVCIGGGLALHVTGVCPIIKRIWTPSWALFSGGICIWTLLVLFTVLDVVRFRFWAWPLMIVGTNSLAAYTMYQMLRGPTAKALTKHLGSGVFRFDFSIGGYDVAPGFGPETQTVINAFEPTIQACMVGGVFWIVLLYMYRKRIFIRI